jgi:hypothetical protein
VTFSEQKARISAPFVVFGWTAGFSSGGAGQYLGHSRRVSSLPVVAVFILQTAVLKQVQGEMECLF